MRALSVTRATAERNYLQDHSSAALHLAYMPFIKYFGYSYQCFTISQYLVYYQFLVAGFEASFYIIRVTIPGERKFQEQKFGDQDG